MIFEKLRPITVRPAVVLMCIYKNIKDIVFKC